MRRYVIVHLTVVFLFSIASGFAQEFVYKVKHRHILKDCTGTLKITPDGVDFVASKTKDNRKWSFEDIRSFAVKSPTEISIVTYEDQKRWAGKDKVFELTLVDSKATPELTSFLLEHVKRPMQLAVIPEQHEAPAYEIPVKHLRTISGTRGILRIYSDRVTYTSSTVGDSRYWRIADIQRFSQPDRFRFEIVSYTPKAGGPTEIYNFQLINDLPEGVYDYLWVRLHPSSYYPEIKR